MRRGTPFIAGPPTGSPRTGLVTTPTPLPRSSSIPIPSRHETRTVRCAPCVTSGSSPASYTTMASAQAPPSPTSHRSTSKETRRSSPFFGSLTSTLSCGSPVRRANAAALAAAAAQVPVVQPVLSFSSLTRAMLGGMGGSRSFRLGGIFPLLRGPSLAEHVGEPRAVEMGTGAARREAPPNQDKRLTREARLPHAVRQLPKRALDDQLVRPARLVDHRARGVAGVATFYELLLQGARSGCGEEDRHRRPVGGEALYLLAVRHRGAAGPARQDHRLRNLRHGQLPTDGRRRCPEGGDPGHDLPLEPDLLAELRLLHNRPIEARVAGVNPGHPQILHLGPLVEVAHALERDSGGLDDLGIVTRVLQHALAHQAPRPDHDVRLAHEPRSPHGQ